MASSAVTGSSRQRSAEMGCAPPARLYCRRPAAVARAPAAPASVGTNVRKRSPRQDYCIISERRPRNAARCKALDIDVRVASNYDEQWASAALRVVSFREDQTVDPQRFSEAVEEEFLNIQKAVSGSLNMTKFETLIATADIFSLPPLENASLCVDDPQGHPRAVVGTTDVVMMSIYTGGYQRQPSLTAYVANVCVHPTARRQRVAARLVQEAKDLSLFWGADVIFVQVESSNRPAVSLYTRHGFTNTRDIPEREGLLTLSYTPKLNIYSFEDWKA